MDASTIFMFVLVEILLIAGGACALFAPNTMWHIEHFLDVRGGEPTDFYIVMTRIGGGMALVGTVILPFLTWVL
ncbi:hypothetical protein KIH79_01795 [Bifidobacterium sp. 82T10]|uniref:DUF6199 domain-containing protein n=1 Tax=Bifidobacterium miconis TaxID=2834435 RepID=A0ABS6WDD1_9BIFI|nr:DUF6199 family natural product biosynthesis protein [Bifidobacterium miconis]MBW3091705.1 hypothetical protein [Bifidobacterium miconis]